MFDKKKPNAERNIGREHVLLYCTSLGFVQGFDPVPYIDWQKFIRFVVPKTRYKFRCPKSRAWAKEVLCKSRGVVKQETPDIEPNFDARHF
jgi:hypothetical protein